MHGQWDHAACGLIFYSCFQGDFAKAEDLHSDGEKFIEDDHYAVDCIRPKCIELQRICEQYKELIRKRNELLLRSKELHERLDRVSLYRN
jgi:hypothetical protein